MQLKPGTLLQGGKYRIIRTLGQGGFGITYESEQVLLHRTVALKEFFMKDCCERDEGTSRVSVPTQSNRELVEKFKGKFIREAQMIAGFDQKNIVRILDVFEENGTAYYVMDNLPGGSLAEKVKREGPLSEGTAEKYIREVAEALAFIHEKDTVHLDVKPSNILLNAKGEAVIIDFGISKHYDKAGEQTSSTPVGISKGYAPLEQSRDGDVSQFKPSTDIYALGATLYYLVSGTVPPEASIVAEDGLPYPNGLSDRLWRVIEQSMRPFRKDRPQSVAEFLALLDGARAASPALPGKDESEETVVKPRPEAVSSKLVAASAPKKVKTWLWALLAGIVVIGIILGVVFGGRGKPDNGPVAVLDSLEVVSEAPAAVTAPDTKPAPQPEPEMVLGSVKVSSEPSGAAIWLDGKNTKKITPEILEDLTPGKHSVKLVLEGYKDYSGSFTITSGKQVELSQTLAEKEKLKPEPLAKATTGKVNGHEWVDLGLSVKWATCNVGASSPSDYGSYFAWGETSPKSDYSWENYKFRTSGDMWDNVTFSKYNTKSERGTVDNKTCLTLSDDAARANWGGTWRTPTHAEWGELRHKCDWNWTSQGGKNGYKVTSKTNGNSIFLPAGGYGYKSSIRDADTRGVYLSSSLDEMMPYCHWGVLFYSENVEFNLGNRQIGDSVRPVTE